MKIVVGDACGHGLCAALLMTSARSYLRARTMQSGDLSQVVTDVNSLLCRDTRKSGFFVTLFYAVIDAQERRIEWVGAGHPPALLVHPPTQEVVSLSGKGTVLGVDPHQRYRQFCRNDLPVWSILLIGSDGLWELETDEGYSTMREKIADFVLKHPRENAATLAEAIKKMVNTEGEETLLQDDVTLVVVKLG